MRNKRQRYVGTPNVHSLNQPTAHSRIVAKSTEYTWAELNTYPDMYSVGSLHLETDLYFFREDNYHGCLWWNGLWLVVLAWYGLGIGTSHLARSLFPSELSLWDSTSFHMTNRTFVLLLFMLFISWEEIRVITTTGEYNLPHYLVLFQARLFWWQITSFFFHGFCIYLSIGTYSYLNRNSKNQNVNDCSFILHQSIGLAYMYAKVPSFLPFTIFSLCCYFYFQEKKGGTKNCVNMIWACRAWRIMMERLSMSPSPSIYLSVCGPRHDYY